MADLSITGEVVVTSEKAESAFDRVGASASQMANEVSASAGKAGQAVDKIGDGAGNSAEKFTRAESRISASIKRATNELELLGKTASQKLEFNISDKGLDPKKFEPMLQRLREVEAQAAQAQRAATGSLDKMGISAGQTAAALRQLPAQFTDIVTSLQGGQAPLTVLLQQGGQIKDSFGGAGNAVRALGGYVLGLVNPFTVAAAAGAALAVAYNQGSKEADAYRLSLVTTGNAAGTTSAQLKSYAQEISGLVGTQGKAAESLAALAATGKVSAENLREAAQAAVQYERATGQATSKTAEQFASLRNEPLSAVLKLNEGMNFLTESTYKQIKSLEEQGRVTDAANVAQKAFADTLTSRGADLERSLGSIERGWLRVKDAAKGAWDAILNVGRADTVGDRLSAARAQLEQKLNTPLAVDNPAMRGSREKAIAALREEINLLSEQERMTRRGAEAEAQRAEQLKAQVSFDKAGEKFLSDKIKMERELALARVQGAEAGKSQAEIEERLKQIRESYVKKGGSSVAAENKELRDQQRIFADLAGVSSTYYAELANYQKQRASGVATEEQYVLLVEQLIQKQPFAVALAKEEAAANTALAKAYQEAAAERMKNIASMERAADGLQSQNEALRDEIELIGLTAEQQTLVLQQRNEAIILTKEATLAEFERQSAITGTQTRVEIALASEIAALKERNALLGAKGVKNAAVDAAKSAADEWQKTTDSINQSLTDSLLRGFESGKDFAKNLRDTVVNMFKTMVLRPVISAIINPISGALTGMMGLSGAAQAGQGMSAIGAAGNLFSAGSALGGLGAVGGALSGFTTAATASIQSLVGMSGTVAQMTTSLAAAGHTAASGVSAGVQAFQAIPGWGWAIAGIAALAAIFSKKATPHAGGASTYSEAGGLVSSADIYRSSGLADTRTYNAEISTALTGNVAKAIGDTLNATAKAFGQTAGYEITTAFADDTSKDGAWGSLMIRRGGEPVIDWRDTQTSKWAPKEFADGEAGSKEYLAEVAKSARDALVGAIGDVDWATGMLTALGDTVSLESLAQTVQQINAAKAAFVGFGQYMPAFASLADSAVSKIVQASGGVDALAGNMSVFVDGFYTDAEKLAINTENVRAAMERLGFEMPATREEFKALVQAQIALGDAGAATAAGLLSVAGAFAGVTQSAEEAAAMARASAEKARSSALAQLDASVQRERALWTAQADAAASLRDEVQGIFDTLATNIRDLRNEGMGEALSAAQGRVFIASAQAAVQAGAGLPDNDALADAIAAARGGIAASGAYGNSIEREFAALALAGELAVLQEAAGEQLSTAELQLRAAESQIEQIDETLVYWRKLIDGTNAGIDATLSVADAVRSLQGLMFPEAEQPDAPAPGSSGGFSIGGGGGGAPAPAAASLSRLGNTYLGAGGTAIVDRAYIDRFDSINQFVNTLDFSASGAAATSVAALSSAALQYGVSANEIAIATGYRLEDVEALLPGIPRYKRGTNFVPEDGLAFLHKGEQVLPVAPQGAPYQPPMADNSQVVALLQQIAQRVAALESHASTSADANTQTADVLTRASQGDALTTAAAPTIA